MPVSAATFTDPPGDPDAVEDAAARLSVLATDLDALASTLRTHVPGADSWRGATADGVRVSAEGTAAAITRAAAALQPAAPALTTWAADLRNARRVMGGLRGDWTAEVQRHAQQMRRLQAEAAAAALQPTGIATQTRPLFGPDPIMAELARHSGEENRLARAADQVCDDLDDQALVCRRALEDTCSAFVRGHRESIDDYLQGVATELLTQVPVLGRHPETVESAVWAVLGAPPAMGAGYVGARRAVTLYNALARNASLFATRFTPAQSALLRGLGLSSWLDESSAVYRAWLGTERTANLVTTFTTAARGGGLSGVLAGARAAGSAGGVSRFLGVGGGVAATALSGANLVAQGNPWTALQENGTEYVADLAEFGFNASLTAVMVAPTPFTVGAVAVTGIAYAGLEIWNHRDDIVQLAQGVGPLVADSFDAARDFAGDALDTGRDLVDGALDTAADIGSALNPFD